jgi:hypothetical protein
VSHCFRRNIGGHDRPDYNGTRDVLNLVQFDCWRRRGKSATLAWLLIGAKLGIGQELTQKIALYVYNSTNEDIWSTSC